MARRKRRTTTPARRRRAPAAAKRTRRRSSNPRLGNEGKIFLATFAMQVMAGLIDKLAATLKLPIPQQYLVPFIIWLLAKRKIIPVEGLDTVSMTLLARNVLSAAGLNYLGYGQFHNPAAGSSANVRNLMRTPSQTAAAIQRNLLKSRYAGPYTTTTRQAAAKRGYGAGRTGRTLARASSKYEGSNFYS